MSTEARSPHEQASRADRLLSRRLLGIVALDPQAPAVEFEGGTWAWSYFSEAVADLQALLAGRPETHRVGIVLRNRPAILAAVIAVISTGREVITLSPHLGDTGLAEEVRALAPSVVIADPQDWARASLSEAAAQVRAFAADATPARAIAPRETSWTPAPRVEPADDVAVLMMTSGTTGRPKRVPLTYQRLTSSLLAARMPIRERDEFRLRQGTAILWASLAHISGLFFAISNAASGRRTALLEKFDVNAWAEFVRLHRPRFASLPPTTMRMLLDAEVPRELLQSLRAVGSGTAPLPPDLAEEFEDRYGIAVLATYGATEFAGSIAGWTLPDRLRWRAEKRGSVGRAYHGIELRVVDVETHLPVPRGEIGLLEARGGQLPIDDGEWLRTTDLASLDEDGFLFIHGRADDAINRGGFKIPPSVVQDALAEHPAVRESTCVGIPDARLGEVPVVAVTVDREVDEAELLDWLGQRLTRYQLPVALKIVDELPLTPSLKVSRPAVAALFDAGAAVR